MLGFPFSRKFKNSKIKRRKEIEPQEVFLDNLAQKREKETGILEKKLEVPLSRKIILAVFILFVFFAAAGMGQTFYLQVIKNKDFTIKAEQNKFITEFISSSRGVIYDINGKQLAYNNPSFDLTYGQESEISENVIQELSKILNINPLQIKDRIEKKEKIAENLDHQALIILQTKNFPGFEIKENSIRHYEDAAFSHVIGYTGKSDNIGKDGLEKYYENYLRKNPGEIQIERDVYGNVLSKKLISMPESGNNLVLWIDSDLQKKAEEELKATLERIGSKSGVVIIQNPKTGGIMSMVSIPSYDNNLFNANADQEALKQTLGNPNNSLFNRAISGLYPTGSTIKPLIAIAALEENTISPSKKINDMGYIEIKNIYNPSIIYKYSGIRPHGWVDMKQAIAVSSNIYFYTIGGGYGDQQGLGPTRIKKYLELFGWGDKTNIDLPGESKGFIPYPDWKRESKGEPWTDGDTYHMSIGQGDLLVTPIEVVTAFSAIANGGTLYKSELVKKIVDENKNLVKEIKPEIINVNFISPDNLKIIKEGMRAAVTGQNAPLASSITLNSLPVEVAAKTGTAETPYKGIYHNWVSVFGPYDDAEIVITVMIENVPGVQVAALPTAKNILQWYFTR